MRFCTTVLYVIPLVLVSVHSKSIGSSENNVSKSEVQDDPFPDWVPFKNKHGEELGKFLQVETASKKPKKRLALPMNFFFRSVADAEPDEYFDKSLGDAYGDDYSEKREWSDTFVPGKPADPIKHTELSEINDVVGIITRQNPQATIKPIKKYKERTTKKPKSKPRKTIDYSDDEDDEKSKPDLTGEERRESEARKALILEGVDELKEKHALEQKAISEKVKEEAMYTEERDRDIMRQDIFDKYRRKLIGRSKDYEEFDGNYEDKYKITPLRKTTPTPSSTESQETTYEISTLSSTPKMAQTGRMSVFRNPSIYMIYDEETTTDSPTSILTSSSTPATVSSSSSSEEDENPTLNQKLHDKLIAPPKRVSVNKSERISLVPQDNELREGEPTLFFPQKMKRRSQNKTKHNEEKSGNTNITAPSQDELPHNDVVWAGSATAPSASASLESATALDSNSKESLEFSSASGSVGSAAIQTGPSSAGETAASAPAAEVTGPPTAPVNLDAISASTDVKEEKEKEKDHEHEKGGKKEHHSEHHSDEGESGKKAYEGYYEDTKTEKGHHDKEDHKGKYHDHGGVDKEHHDEKKHYGSHHHEEHGKKHAEYEESGKHSKGHSTKGSHDIHKKEEYEKNVEFFEEEGDFAEEEKDGGHHTERGHKKGGHYKKHNDDASFHERTKGDAGHFNKAGHIQAYQGFGKSGGHDSHGKHGTSHQSDGAKKSGKKWIYHHGFPARNANLVVIDRRNDQLYHGPQYYG